MDMILLVVKYGIGKYSARNFKLGRETYEYYKCCRFLLGSAETILNWELFQKGVCLMGIENGTPETNKTNNLTIILLE